MNNTRQQTNRPPSQQMRPQQQQQMRSTPPQQQMRSPPPQQQQQMRPQQQQQQQQMRPQQQQTLYPSHVTVPQAIAVIISRLNKIDGKLNNTTNSSNPSLNLQNEDDSSNNQLIHQILERLTNIESVSVDNKLADLTSKINKFETELRESKDIIMKLQSFIMDTNTKLAQLSNTDEETLKLSIKEMVLNELSTSVIYDNEEQDLIDEDISATIKLENLNENIS